MELKWIIDLDDDCHTAVSWTKHFGQVFLRVRPVSFRWVIWIGSRQIDAGNGTSMEDSRAKAELALEKWRRGALAELHDWPVAPGSPVEGRKRVLTPEDGG